MTGADVYVADQLFATLDTRTRAWNVPHFGQVLLSDTVGFIRDLPHNLVASFRSTLEEARHADLLLHVVDASSPRPSSRSPRSTKCSKRSRSTRRGRCWSSTRSTRSATGRTSTCCGPITNWPSPSARSTRTGLDQLARIVAERLGDGYVEATLETERRQRPAAVVSGGPCRSRPPGIRRFAGDAALPDPAAVSQRASRRRHARAPGQRARCGKENGAHAGIRHEKRLRFRETASVCKA